MATELSITVRLGFPEVGRTQISYPLGAVVFESDDYHVGDGFGQRKKRIGQVPPTGQTITASLYLFAANEYALLELVDSLHTAKATVASVTADSVDIVVRYGPTSRTQVLDSKNIENTVVTQVTFTWN